MSQLLGAALTGTGSCLPTRIVPNEEFAETLNLDTSDEWIRTRTGIRARRFAGVGESSASLGPIREHLRGVRADRARRSSQDGPLPARRHRLARRFRRRPHLELVDCNALRGVLEQPFGKLTAWAQLHFVLPTL